MALTNSVVETYVLRGNASRQHFFPDDFTLVNLHSSKDNGCSPRADHGTHHRRQRESSHPFRPFRRGSMLAGLEIDYHPCAIGGICAVFPHSSLHLSPIIFFLFLDPQSVLRDREGERRDALRKPEPSFLLRVKSKCIQYLPPSLIALSGPFRSPEPPLLRPMTWV